jgi:hypothetical protein
MKSISKGAKIICVDFSLDYSKVNLHAGFFRSLTPKLSHDWSAAGELLRSEQLA